MFRYKRHSSGTSSNTLKVVVSGFNGVNTEEYIVFDFSRTSNPPEIVEHDGGKWSELVSTCLVDKSFASLSQYATSLKVELSCPTAGGESGQQYSIDDFQLFKVYRNAKGDIIYPDAGTIIEAQIKDRYIFYRPDANYTKEEDIVPLYDGSDPLGPKDNNNNYIYTPWMTVACERIGSLNGAESNRFNLLQNLCETFECWVRFDIEHDANGKITLVNDTPIKR